MLRQRAVGFLRDPTAELINSLLSTIFVRGGLPLAQREKEGGNRLRTVPVETARSP